MANKRETMKRIWRDAAQGKNKSNVNNKSNTNNLSIYADGYVAPTKKSAKTNNGPVADLGPVQKKEKNSLLFSSVGSDWIGELLAPIKEEENMLDKVKLSTGGINSRAGEFFVGATNDQRKWFQKGEFEDGYQRGDITKTILGSASDFQENFTQGLLGIGETAIDAGAYALGAIGKATGGSSEKIERFIKKDLINEEAISKSIFSRGALGVLSDVAGADTEKSSVFAERSDSLIQSTGQLGGQIALQAVGVPWYVTTGATSFGAEAENALNQGATFGQAGASAAIKAGSDILTEKLFGGSGLGEKGLINVDKFTKGISNKVVKTLFDYGIDVVGEGGEEVAASFFSKLGDAIYKDESFWELATSEEAVDEYLESFIGGAVLGGGMNSVKAVQSAKNKTDYRTGLSANEQKLFDSVFKEMVKNEEDKNGNKMTAKEKKTLEQNALEYFKKGYVDTETIEDMFGGETYKEYKSVLEQEAELKKAYEEAGHKSDQGLDYIQQDAQKKAYEDAKAKYEEFQNSNKKSELRERLDQEIGELTKNDQFIRESYNEKSRKGQSFEADLTKYDAKQAAVVQKAVDSGILNNTNRTHEFVDLIAKIAADKDASFDFTNNEKLKESGFSLEGKTVNGFVKDGNITLNIQSAKALNTVVGHEITHVMEGTEMYDVLQKAVEQYGNTKGEFTKRYEAAFEAYKNVYKNMSEQKYAEAVKKEVVADMIGDYVFTDTNFVNNLSKEQPNIFQKIYEEIKYLVKVATGTKEAVELEKVKRAFDNAYKENANAQQADIQYAIQQSVEKVTDRLSMQEWSQVKHAISDHNKLDFQYEKSADGDIIIPVNNKLVYTDGNYDSPGINKIIEINSEYENEIDIARRFIYEFEKNKSEISEAYEIIEFAFGYGFIYEYIQKGNESSERYDRRTKRGKSESDSYHSEFMQDRIRRANEIIHSVNSDNSTETSSNDGVFFDTKNKQFSLSTEYDSMPKPKPSLDPTSAGLQKDTRSVREVRSETMLKNGKSEAEVAEVNRFMDEMGEFMKKSGITYQYIGLEDVNNAKIKVTYDKNGEPKKVVLSAMVKNGEYPVNFDFTSICKKRQSISMVIKELAQRKSDGKRTLDVANLDAKALWRINEELRKANLETACLGCFVESKRYNMQNFANKATGMWNKIVDEVRAEQGMEGPADAFNFAEGIDLDSVNYTEVENIFKQYASESGRTSPEARMRALIKNGGEVYQKYLNPSDLMTPEGIEAIKSLSSKKNNFYGILQGVYGQAAPKEVMGFSPYNSEIALLPQKKKNQKMVDYITDIGGVRLQSFSDFLVANVYDYMQMTADLAARKLPAHSYTKEMAFARIFGQSGMKINMSVMFDIDSSMPNEYAGLTFVEDANGNEVYNGVRGSFEYLVADKVRSDAEFERTGERPYVQSIPFNEAVELQNDPRYSKNVGIIGVGYSDNHILKMLGDEDIRYVIPYHASSLPAIIKDASKIRQATDYTDFQNTREVTSITDGNGNQIDYKAFVKEIGANSYAEVFAELQNRIQNEGWNVEYKSSKNLAGLGDFNIYKDVQNTQDPRQTAENYLKHCAENGYLPVFEKFASHENYYKMLFDFDPYDTVTGEYAPQEAVKNIYDGYNPEEGQYSLDSIQQIIDSEMNVQNEANRVRNEKIPSVVDSVLEQLDMKDAETDAQMSISEPGAIAPVKDLNTYGSDIALDSTRESLESIAPLNQVDAQQNVAENIAPLAETIKPDETKETTVIDDIKPSALTFSSTFRDVSETPFGNYKSAKQTADVSLEELSDEMKQAEAEFEKGVLEGESKEEHLARILTAEELQNVKKENPNKRRFAICLANLVDKGLPFENLALKTNNRELMGKWNYTLLSEGRGQRLIGKGSNDGSVKSLQSIEESVINTGHVEEFGVYMYHQLNIDRMTLQDRFGVNNKPVYGDMMTADRSRQIVEALENKYPQFAEQAKDLYRYNEYLRDMMVESGIITQSTADLWAKMYPHYVPIKRQDGGFDSAPIDTTLKATDPKNVGVNAPIWKATGGNADIMPIFKTMSERTLQTIKAIDKNSFGIELKNTLGKTSVVENKASNIDEIVDSLSSPDAVIHKSVNGKPAMFTVFENGNRTTFRITDEMYEALKPMADNSPMLYTNKVINKISRFRKGLITEYNPVFCLTNGIKDIQDVILNSQHPLRTYKCIAESFSQIKNEGHWFQEYMENGGEQNTYFDRSTATIKKDDTGLKKLAKLPLQKISDLNNFIEKVPRLAEYIASREEGRSVEVSMLDAARVTTNFNAGGDFTKMLDRNGCTFLNASTQGSMQQIRNFREARAEGMKGWVKLAAKFLVAGAPAILLNNFLWDDDEEYEELADYVKQNYYVVGKYDDGKFIRIPKGRAASVIQDALVQMTDLVTGDDDLDFKSFAKLVIDNIAPSNPIDNNILAPILQVAFNKTWYGEELVPSRLADLPNAEQFDETTDSFSKWLGEKTDISPVKINYLLDQYSGALGDLFLPMMTPKAESGAEGVGKLLAPLTDKFTTDSVINNQETQDFYTMAEELQKKANSMYATDEDKIRSAYMSAVWSDIGEWAQKKRETQNDMTLSNSAKYAMVRGIQKKINALAEDALQSYENVDLDGNFAEVGDRQFRINDNGKWSNISDEARAKQEEASNLLSITPSQYWDNEKDKYMYDWAVENPEYYQVSKAISPDLKTYWKHNSHIYNNIRADKDANGDYISGTKKPKIIDYINTTNLEYEQRLILYKKYYPADDSYNREIIDYLNSRNDISPEEMETILKELEFKVSADGRISW